MKLGEAFRRWSAQWPEARFAGWLWAICAAALAFGGWSALQRWREVSRESDAAPVSVAAPPSSIFYALRVPQDYPSDRDVWEAAAALLDSSDPARAHQLLRDAAVLPSTPPASDQATPVLARTARLMADGRPSEALAALKGLPTSIEVEPAVLARKATLLAAVQDRPALKQALLAGAWGPANRDSIELAFCAELASRRDDAALAQELWTVALNACGESQPARRVLIRLAECLGLEAQAAASFQACLRSDPNDAKLAGQFALWSHGRSP